MANTFNTGVYKQEWETRLQQRLNKPETWKDVADVRYSDSNVINWPYMATESTVQTGTRGSAYGYGDFALTNSTLTISTKRIDSNYIDFADLAQCQYATQMEMADRQARKLSDVVETAMLATHASWTDFGDTGSGALGLASTAITVSTSNIDDIVSGVRREIIAANGMDQMVDKGVFFVWRAADFEKLEKWAQANGFNLADATLKRGIMTEQGYYLNGAYHYVSNSHTTGHVFAGVRKILRVGILRSTYGRVFYKDEPANADGQLSGVSVTSRIDYGTQIPTGLVTLLYDVNVN